MAKTKQPTPAEDDPDIYPTDPPEEIPGHLPGMAPEKNAKVHNKAMAFIKARDEYNRAKETRDDANNTLIMTMNAEGLSEYHYGDIHVNLDMLQKAKVRREQKADKPAE